MYINPSNTVFVANTVVNQLLSFTQEIHDKLEAGKQTALIVMNFRKVKSGPQNYVYKTRETWPLQTFYTLDSIISRKS